MNLQLIDQTFCLDNEDILRSPQSARKIAIDSGITLRDGVTDNMIEAYMRLHGFRIRDGGFRVRKHEERDLVELLHEEFDLLDKHGEHEYRKRDTILNMLGQYQVCFTQQRYLTQYLRSIGYPKVNILGEKMHQIRHRDDPKSKTMLEKINDKFDFNGVPGGTFYSASLILKMAGVFDTSHSKLAEFKAYLYNKYPDRKIDVRGIYATEKNRLFAHCSYNPESLLSQYFDMDKSRLSPGPVYSINELLTFCGILNHTREDRKILRDYLQIIKKRQHTDRRGRGWRFIYKNKSRMLYNILHELSDFNDLLVHKVTEAEQRDSVVETVQVLNKMFGDQIMCFNTDESITILKNNNAN